jgi:RimJ/RimL family protein N-acetyltransferase
MVAGSVDRVTDPLDAVAWPVHTRRLQIRPATPDDLEATWQIRRLESVARWVSSATQVREEYAETFLEPGRLSTTLVFLLDDRVIGDLMVDIEDGWSQTEVSDQARGVQAELGWVMDPAHGGHGYATEAVAELIRICFEDLGLRRVTALCFADNTASWRLMERLGMRREEHAVGDSLHRSGGWLDGFGYALLAEEVVENDATKCSAKQRF